MMNTPPGPTLMGIDVIWVGTILAFMAVTAVLFAIYTAVTIRDPMQKRVKALNDRRDQLKSGLMTQGSRKRAQMKLKIRAMSSESKASAYIVGSLPFIVFGMIYWINPQYLGGFFTDDRLILIGLGGAVWMSLGAFIMAKMVSFEI